MGVQGTQKAMYGCDSDHVEALCRLTTLSMMLIQHLGCKCPWWFSLFKVIRDHGRSVTIDHTFSHSFARYLWFWGQVTLTTPIQISCDEVARLGPSPLPGERCRRHVETLSLVQGSHEPKNHDRYTPWGGREYIWGDLFGGSRFFPMLLVVLCIGLSGYPLQESASRCKQQL